MAYINRKKVLQVVKVVGGGGGGGNVDLNLAYGSTPPQDTNKVWIKCDEPSKVIIEANRELVVSSSENAKLVKSEEIGTTYLNSSGYKYTNPFMVKIGNDYYIASDYNYSSYINGNQVSSAYVKKIDSEGNISNVANITATHSIALFKYDNTHILWVKSDTSSPYNTRFFLIDITNNNITTYNTSIPRDRFNGCCLFGNTLYGINGQDNASTYVYFTVYTLGGNAENYTVSMPSGLTRWVVNTNPIYYNGALYFILNVGTTSTNTNQPTLYKWVIGASEIVEVMTLPKIAYSGGNYAIAMTTPFIYGNKMILTNMTHYHSTSLSTPEVSYIYIVDLDNATYETIDLGTNYSMAYVCLNDNTGDIEIWGGLGYSNTTKKTIYNIYELEHNTLDLFYDNYFNKNIKLVDMQTLTINAPIDHAWLGDSNDIAQPVEMRYYEEGVWWGVNCLGWTQLESCVISAVDVAIDMASTTTDTQTITVTPTWAYETGEITVSVESSDDTKATASISNLDLTITAVATGTATITITVVDEYNTTFTQTITATITNTA